MRQFRLSFSLLSIGLLAGCSLYPAPQVSIINPGSITSNTLTVNVVASGTNGIKDVELLLNGTSLGQKNSAPFSWSVTLNRAQNGTNTLTAIARNPSLGVAYAAPESFSVNIAPSISLVSSSPTITSSTPVTLTATPTDSSAGFAKVEFYQGTTLLGTDTAAPFTQNVSFTQASQNGSYNYSAKSFDAAGNTATSSLLPIAVSIADSTMPTVVLTATGSSSGIALSATATDDVGISRIEFYSGTNLIATDTTAPYDFTFGLMAAGNQFPNYTAKAFDAAGNSTTSNAIQDVWESNNTTATALMLDAMPVRTQAGVTLGGSLDGTAPDVDYYAVSMTFAQVLKVRTYSSGGADTMVRIFNAAGVQLAFNDASGDYNNTDSAINWRASDNGVYYIAVSAYTNGVTPAIQDASKQYRMTVQVGD